MTEGEVPQAWLLDEAGRRTEIVPHMTVGRAPANSMVIVDAEHRVSQYHARVEQDALGRVFLEDRHSTNGTFVNERKITRRELQDGDRIRFGSQMVYTFRCALTGTASVAEKTVMGMTSRHYEERELWFVVGDVKRSSELVTAMGNNAFSRLMTEWAARCRGVVEENGGMMANRTGDGWLLIWNASAGSEVGVGAAIRGLQALQRRAEPDFRMCIHRGRATVGGGVLAGEDNILSAELHQAFRMEKIAARLTQNIVASEAAVAELKKVLPCELLPGEFDLRGFTGLHRFYRVG
jgi:pSer/pThr/pTyr-binding forkhead associated (FHA) protein